MSILNTIFSTQGKPSSELYIDKTDDNYGIGESLTFHADAEDNIAIGENALNRTSGAALKNIAIGTDALTAITTNDQNIAIGHQTLDQLTLSGGNNIAIGFQAMHGISGDKACHFNVAIGSYALDGNLSAAAAGTVAIGAYAGSAISSGEKNTAVGYTALANQSTGDNNVAVGYEALYTNATTDAGDNTAVGYTAAKLLAGGVDNVVIGSLALVAADGAESDNVCIGRSAMSSVNNDACTKNTIVGRSAGIGGVGDMNNCVAVGYG